MGRCLAMLLLLAAVAVGQNVPSAGGFAKGADVGWLPQMEASGFVFRDDQGHPKDCLTILKDHGIDTIRLRVWVNPSDHPKSGHCSPGEVVQMASRASKMGFRIMIDFHYSDSWADPAHQRKPKAWKDLEFPELKLAVGNHTREVLQALKRAKVTPEWVQVGNEIPDGMLWPDGRASTNGRQLAELINAGHDAVKSVDPKIKVIVHLDRGNQSGRFRTFFDRMEKYGARYDVIGLSYYPYWLREKKDFRLTINDLGANLKNLVERYDKEVMVVEVGGESRKPEETAQMLEAVIRKVREVPKGRGLGVVYWEPQGAASWSRYPLSCWGSDGRPSAALDAFLD